MATVTPVDSSATLAEGRGASAHTEATDTPRACFRPEMGTFERPRRAVLFFI